MTDVEHGLLCSFSGLFPSDPDGRIDEAFVLGVEFGMVWAALKGQTEYEKIVHAENQEAFRRAANALDFDLEMEPTKPPTQGWVVARFKRREARPRLRIVT